MAYFYKREPVDEIEQQLLNEGWRFAGISLFEHPRIYNRFFTKQQAIDDTRFDENTKIVIKVKGPHAKEVAAEFWAWFLDGGGAQQFCDPEFNDTGYSFYETYDKDENRWIIQVEE